MKHIYYGTAFALMITVIISSVVCFQLIQAKGEDVKSSKKNDLAIVQTVQIEFKKPVTLDALFPTETLPLFDGMILEGEFMFNGEAIYDFYMVDSKDKKKNIKEDYIKNRKAFLADTMEVTKISPANYQNVENILVTKITVAGKKGNINKMKKGLEISKINIKPVQSIAAPQIFEKSVPKEVHLLDNKIIGSKTFSITAESTSLGSSVPNSGSSHFYPSAYGGRAVKQYMKWDSINFSEEQTYEHDVFLYNYDRKTYLDGDTTSYPGGWPELEYAATSWPAASKPYIDTRFNMYMVSCDKNELAYTIGAAQASALQANTNYVTYIRTENGNDSSDKFYLKAQIGHRIPDFCYTTWCSFGDESFSLISAWDSTVPGDKTWTYNKVPAAPSNVFINNPTTTSLQVHFTDNAVDETNILIQNKDEISGIWFSLGGFGILPGTSSWYWTNTGLLPWTTYCYRLRAINNFGSSAYSNEACGTTL